VTQSGQDGAGRYPAGGDRVDFASRSPGVHRTVSGRARPVPNVEPTTASRGARSSAPADDHRGPMSTPLRRHKSDEADRALRDAQQMAADAMAETVRLRRALDALNSAIVIHDAHGQLVLRNRQHAELDANRHVSALVAAAVERLVASAQAGRFAGQLGRSRPNEAPIEFGLLPDAGPRSKAPSNRPERQASPPEAPFAVTRARGTFRRLPR